MSYRNTIPSDYIDEEKINPGQRLRFLLEERYSEESYLQDIDFELGCDGKLKDLVYSSTINYVLRRFIASAAYLNRKYEQHGDGRVRVELRKYFKDFMKLDESIITEIVGLLMEALRNSSSNFNQTEKRIAKSQVKKYNWGCYICGRSIHFIDSDDPKVKATRATADHKWPRFFGGNSTPGNLRYACSDCNNKYKQDFLDYSDYHYEEIALVIDSYENYIEKSRNRSYEAAIFAKNDYNCIVCSQPAYRVGELYIGRIDLSDSWHFLNLTSYCQFHKPE